MSPAFLGLLRPKIDAQTQKTIVAEATKDIVEHDTADIEWHLAQL